MTSQQIGQVEKTYATIRHAGAGFTQMLFRRLFVVDPSMRRLFRGDLHQHGQELIDMLGVAVGSLRHLELIAPEVKALGQRHVAYGVQQRDYATFTAAMLWTLEQILSVHTFTPEIKGAWQQLGQTLTCALRVSAAVAIAA